MAKRDIIAIASKISGLYMLLRAVEEISPIVRMIVYWVTGYSPNMPRFMLSFSALSLALFVIVSFCLIKGADSVAGILCAGEERGEIKGTLDPATIEQIAFVAIGVFVLANGIGSVVRVGVRLGLERGAMWSRGDLGELIALGARLAIGAYLVLGSRGLARIIDNLRRA